MNNSRISITIPTYNRAYLLKKCLDSIIPQFYECSDYEIIVCNNASTDDTDNMLADITKKYPFVRYFSNSVNLGFDGNVVRCMEVATGEYIFLLSDDDYVLPGTLKRIKDAISESHPTMICLSHYGFEGDEYLIKRKVLCPDEDKYFENGQEFFLYAGLGFISSLIVKTESARQFLKRVRMGKGCAHLDVCSRVALTTEGPYVYLGTNPIAARIPDKPGYDLMLNGFIYVNQLYRELESEGLLSAEIVNKRERALLSYDIPRHVLFRIIEDDRKSIYAELKLFKKELAIHWQFYLYVYPILIIPRSLLIVPYKLFRCLIRIVRRYWYN
jgi:glycosyltransferase involved in cell wall biosynthesis